MKIFIVVISLLLDGLFSRYIEINGFLYPLFTLVSLVMICPGNYENNNFKWTAFFAGLAYDLFYTNTLVFNAFLFLFISVIINKLKSTFEDNFLNMLVTLLITIFIFRSITYLMMVITGNLSFNLNTWFKGIYRSLIANIVYYAILYCIMRIFIKQNKKSLY